MSNMTAFAYKFDGGILQWYSPQLRRDDQLLSAAEEWNFQYSENRNCCHWRAVYPGKRSLSPPCVCSIDFDDFQCDQLLTSGDSMGNCHILTTTAAQQNFASANMLLLRKGKKFILLEFANNVSGELFWCGVWANGSVSKFRAEKRERFAGKDTPEEIEIGIYSSGDPQELLNAWAKRHYPQPVQRQIAEYCAWSSWDYFRWSITAEDVLANAEFIARDPVLRQHIKRIVIDDGWMNCYGEWEPNSRFKNMPDLVRELKKMNFSAGLWFAPGIAEPQSLFAQKNWQYLARNENDWPCLAFECMSRRGFLLDPTRPEVQQYLSELFRHYRAMGFDYFKLDFLKQTLNARKFYNRQADAAEIIRSLIKPIREGAGKDAILMGCNYLFSAGNEYLDIVRCASDIHANYDSIQHNSTSIAARLPLHNIAWRNDPDFALVRGPETSDDPAMDLLRPNQVYINTAPEQSDDFCGKWCCAGSMSRSEAEILLSLVLISGGEMTFSDDLTRLNPCGIELVRMAASAPRGNAGTADDLLQGEYAQQFTQQVSSNHWRKLWINWQNQDQLITLQDLPAPSAVLTDFWHGRVLSCNQTLTLPGRSCLLLDMIC